ncbi:MAG TPA: ATP-binding protein [Geobacteraceae bacterium]
MSEKRRRDGAGLREEIEAHESGSERVRRQIALLQAIIRIFRESADCATEEDMAQFCLEVAQDLTGSSYGFMGEMNQEGRFDTTTLSRSGWDACKIPREEAVRLLRNMPNRGINRIGLMNGKSWIVNDPASHAESVEKPAGHPELTSFLGVPLFFMGGITGMVALAGKKGGFTGADQRDIEALSAAFSESLNRRRAEKRISELNTELSLHVMEIEAVNKELEAFSYSVSHDLRAPLRHITGFVELLNKRDLSSLDEKGHHYLEVISTAAQQMGVLIDDLLSFSRMGRAELMKIRVDFTDLVEDVINSFREETAGRSVTWEIASLPVVEGDLAMLRLVMVNLLANALKFTRSRTPALIGIGAITDRPGETVFYVRDNGVGFDMKYADKLFGLFQRLHSTGEFEGTGVGLANVQRIVRRHGGRVWAEGEPDHGATFWFSLPKKAEET